MKFDITLNYILVHRIDFRRCFLRIVYLGDLRVANL